jgi:hypothetical protein
VLKSEEFVGWVKEHSKHKFVRSKTYKQLIGPVIFEGSVFSIIEKIEEKNNPISGWGDIIAVIPLMSLDEQAKTSISEYCEMVSDVVDDPTLFISKANLKNLSDLILTDLEKGYSEEIARNYGIILEALCVGEQYWETPLISMEEYDDYGLPDKELYESRNKILSHLVRSFKPSKLRGIIGNSQEVFGIIDYCRYHKLLDAPIPWIGHERNAYLYKTYSTIAKDVTSKALTGLMPDIQLDNIGNAPNTVFVDSLQDIEKTELYQENGVFDGTVLYRVQQPNLDTASCWLLLGRIGVELYGVPAAKGFFTLYKKEIQDIIQNRDTESIIGLYKKLLDPYVRARRISDKPGAVMFRALSQIGDIGVY